MPAGGLIALGIGTAASTVGQIMSAEAAGQQEEAAMAVRDENLDALNLERRRQSKYKNQQLGLLTDAGAAGRADLMSGYSDATGALGQGFGMARSDVASGLSGARGALTPTLGLQSYTAGAAGPLGATRFNSRVGNLLDDPTAFQADPGYQFRLQQGTQAIERATAARGGRGSGRFAKELQGFSQGLASQEVGAAFERAQAADAQEMALAAREDALRTQAQQNQLTLATMGYAASNQLAGYNFGAGNTLAGLSSGFGQGMAGLASDRGGALSGLGVNIAGAQSNVLGNFGQQSMALTNMANQQRSMPVDLAGGGLAAAAEAEYAKANMWANAGGSLSAGMGGGGGGSSLPKSNPMAGTGSGGYGYAPTGGMMA